MVRAKTTRAARAAAWWLFVACLPLLLISSAVRIGLNSTRIYEYGFDKYGISDVTQLDRTQLSEIAERLIDYFNSKVDTPQMTVVDRDGREFELFHDYELIHLEDVKGLFRAGYRIQAASLAYIILYVLLLLLWEKGRRQGLAKGTRLGCMVTLGVIAAAGIGALFSFERLFIQFHLISFSNPYWMLNPGTDYLIMLFPGGFWQDVALIGGGIIAGEALLLGGVAWAAPSIYRRHARRRHPMMEGS
jgi:integral membrane protein (TIGR01906 family)